MAKRQDFTGPFGNGTCRFPRHDQSAEPDLYRHSLLVLYITLKQGKAKTVVETGPRWSRERGIAFPPRRLSAPRRGNTADEEGGPPSRPGRRGLDRFVLSSWREAPPADAPRLNALRDRGRRIWAWHLSQPVYHCSGFYLVLKTRRKATKAPAFQTGDRRNARMTSR
jgi:hypothetical protein